MKEKNAEFAACVLPQRVQKSSLIFFFCGNICGQVSLFYSSYCWEERRKFQAGTILVFG